jgi:hypothetical protein
VVGKVEAAIDPDALLRDVEVVLRRHGPVALGGHPLSLDSSGGSHSEDSRRRTRALCLRCMVAMTWGVARGVSSEWGRSGWGFVVEKDDGVVAQMRVRARYCRCLVCVAGLCVCVHVVGDGRHAQDSTATIMPR